MVYKRPASRESNPGDFCCQFSSTLAGSVRETGSILTVATYPLLEMIIRMKRFTDVTSNFENLLLNFQLHIGGHLENAIVRTRLSQQQLVELPPPLNSQSSHISAMKSPGPQLCKNANKITVHWVITTITFYSS